MSFLQHNNIIITAQHNIDWSWNYAVVCLSQALSGIYRLDDKQSPQKLKNHHLRDNIACTSLYCTTDNRPPKVVYYCGKKLLMLNHKLQQTKKKLAKKKCHGHFQCAVAYISHGRTVIDHCMVCSTHFILNNNSIHHLFTQ